MRGAVGEGGIARRAAFQRSGERDLSSDGRADDGKQPEFTSGVKCSRSRASEAARTACLAQTGDGVTHAPGKMSSGAQPTGTSRRDSLPPLNVMPVVQVVQAVQHVLRKRDAANAGRSNE